MLNQNQDQSNNAGKNQKKDFEFGYPGLNNGLDLDPSDFLINPNILNNQTASHHLDDLRKIDHFLPFKNFIDPNFT